MMLSFFALNKWKIIFIPLIHTVVLTLLLDFFVLILVFCAGGNIDALFDQMFVPMVICSGGTVAYFTIQLFIIHEYYRRKYRKILSKVPFDKLLSIGFRIVRRNENSLIKYTWEECWSLQNTYPMMFLPFHKRYNGGVIFMIQVKPTFGEKRNEMIKNELRDHGFIVIKYPFRSDFSVDKHYDDKALSNLSIEQIIEDLDLMTQVLRKFKLKPVKINGLDSLK